MIETQDWVLVMLIVIAAVLITSLLWVIYGTQRTWDLKLEHQLELEMKNREIIEVRDTLAGREIRDRVMGSTPVGRLIGGDDG